MKITICGSSTFVKDMTKAQKHLEEEGHEVFVPNPLVTEEWYQENHGRENFLKMKPIWTQRHFKRIENSNAVLIFNNEKKGIAGYLGPNTLIFNSGDRLEVLGKGHDLFISFRKKDGSWSQAVNMGKEINSPQSDYSAIISADGKYIFFSSSRSDNIDIYWIDAKKIDQLGLEEQR